PCSGSGRWRRAPETKWRLTQQGLADLHEIQTAILHQAAHLVRPQGRLAYVTCSLLSSENDRQIDGFLEQNQSFDMFEADGPLGQRARHMLHPENNDSDGLYVALLQRRADDDGA
ncbi:MAG: hypothetical protein L7U47_03045, partial [Alphaproteobacteria bacterium]|nr:hypothetical protein [Alphaproteobacteria bacterium]